MFRILIADGWPGGDQVKLMQRGLPSNVGLFENALRVHEPGVDCRAINIADGDALPAGSAITDFDGVILTGSPLHVGDDIPAVRRQIDFAAMVFASRVPVWGSCWGLQLATVALGGTVRRNPNGREIGIARAIAVTPSGRHHPLLAGRAPVFDAVCSHLDDVATLPPGGEVLAQNGISAVQALAVRTASGGWFFGAQYHPELDLAVVAAIMRAHAADLAAEGFARTAEDVRTLADDYHALSDAPDRHDLAWRYGIGREILDPAQRSVELGNWLSCAVHAGYRD